MPASHMMCIHEKYAKSGYPEKQLTNCTRYLIHVQYPKKYAQKPERGSRVHERCCSHAGLLKPTIGHAPSTVFFGHPKETIDTFGRALGVGATTGSTEAARHNTRPLLPYFTLLEDARSHLKENITKDAIFCSSNEAQPLQSRRLHQASKKINCLLYRCGKHGH